MPNARFSVQETLERSKEAWSVKDQNTDLLRQCYAYGLSGPSPYWVTGTGRPHDEAGVTQQSQQPEYTKFDGSLALGNEGLQNRLRTDVFPQNVRFATFKPAPTLELEPEPGADERDLQGAEFLAFKYIHASNFDYVIGACLQDYTTAGTMFLAQRYSVQQNRFIYTPISQAHIAIDVDSEGEPTAFYRQSVYSYDELVEKFPMMLRVVRRPEDAKANKRLFKIVRACVFDSGKLQWEDSTIMSGGPGVHNAPYRIGDVEFFAREQCPFVMSRWSYSPGEIYGRSPVMAALPSYRMLNFMSQLAAQGMEFAARGLFALAGLSAQSFRELEIAPGSIIRLDNIENFARIQGPTAQPDVMGFIEYLRQDIKQLMLWDKLPDPRTTGNSASATEIAERIQEASRSYSIPLSQLTRFVRQVMRYVLSHIEQEAQGFGNIDESEIVLNSPLASQQDMADATKLAEFHAGLLQMGIDPMIVSTTVDQERLITELARLSGIDLSLIRDEQGVAEKKAELAQMAQAMKGQPQGAPQQ